MLTRAKKSTRNGVQGRALVSGDQVLFLPVSGILVYWSSTEKDSGKAYGLGFSDMMGQTFGWEKTEKLRVRCVRE